MSIQSSLQMRGISKAFPGVQALRDVSLEVRSGEVHALLGENGAGKTTLIKVLGGALAADQGEVLLDGRPVAIAGVYHALQMGIRIVYQELALVPALSVAENVLLADLPRGRLPGHLSRRTTERRAAEVIGRVGLRVDPRTPVRDLPAAQQQMVEIARAIAGHLRILVLDEPTSRLTEHEADHLFGLLPELRRAGVGIIYISHLFDEVFRNCDRATVLRDGRYVATCTLAETGRDHLVWLMAGADVAAGWPRHAGRPAALPRLVVRGLSRRGVLDAIDLDVHPGEVVGLGGLVGSGRTELARCICGLDRYEMGRVTLDGRPVPPGSVAAAVGAGLVLCPEDRKLQGLVQPMTIADNIGLANWDHWSRWGHTARSTLERVGAGLIRSLQVRCHGPRQTVRTLSGGNQQKVVLAKWLAREPRLLVIDEPTRGIDVMAKREVYRLIADLVDRGAGVLLISSEMPELLGVADRVLVMRRGRIAARFDRPPFERRRILAAALGEGSAESAAGGVG